MNHVSPFRNLLILLVIQTLFISFAGLSQTEKKINSLAETCYTRGILNGAILVAEQGNIIYQKTFGKSNMELNVQNELDTRFMIGSVTKQFVAALVLQLVEQGAIKLDAHISDYLPSYPKKVGEKVTIHELLNHSSGIRSYTENQSFEKVMSANLTHQEVLNLFADSSLDFEPGTKFKYNNSGYFLLGMIIEKVTGKRISQVLPEKILIPLGMKNTGFNVSRAIMHKRAAGYDVTFLGGYANRISWHESSLFTAGGMYSTVSDLLLWAKALNTSAILSEQSRRLMFTNNITPGNEEIATLGIPDTSILQGYGYGWFTGTRKQFGSNSEIPVVWHSGTISGFNTMIMLEPQQQRVAIILNNVLVGREKLLKLADDCMNILDGGTCALPRYSLAAELGKLIPKVGIKLALNNFVAHRNDTLNYTLNESEINQLGYELMAAGMLQDAIEVFKINIETFPKSANAYDSMGEAYMNHGDTELAITNYQKSVELDPTNENGKQMLERLKKK